MADHVPPNNLVRAECGRTYKCVRIFCGRRENEAPNGEWSYVTCAGPEHIPLRTYLIREETTLGQGCYLIPFVLLF